MRVEAQAVCMFCVCGFVAHLNALPYCTSSVRSYPQRPVASKCKLCDNYSGMLQ